MTKKKLGRPPVRSKTQRILNLFVKLDETNGIAHRRDLVRAAYRTTVVDKNTLRGALNAFYSARTQLEKDRGYFIVVCNFKQKGNREIIESWKNAKREDMPLIMEELERRGARKVGYENSFNRGIQNVLANKLMPKKEINLLERSYA